MSLGKNRFTNSPTAPLPYSPFHELSVILSQFCSKDIAGLDMFPRQGGTEDTARFLSGVASSPDIMDTPNTLLPPPRHRQTSEPFPTPAAPG